jgi:pyrroline-5-carboxylate reductase
MDADVSPILLVGAGHMGGALIEGWRRCGAFAPADMMIRDPSPGDAAREAGRAGARLAPPDHLLGGARTVVLGVKPQLWGPIVADLAPYIAGDAVVLSIMAGVSVGAIAEILPGRAIGRVMPTTAAAVGRGAASVWAADPQARAHAHALFAPLGVVVDLEAESQIHAATAASGSAPAYVYALVEALQAAGEAAGLAAPAARTLSRAAAVGAAALLEASGEDAAILRRQVTSPAGTTEAALRVLDGDGALTRLIGEAVLAAVARSRELGGET